MNEQKNGPGAEHMKGVMQRYCELVTAGDLDGIVALYAEDAVVEDPVGSEPHRGRAAIREFYAASAGTLELELEGRPRVVDNQAVAAMRATPNEGGGMYVETTDLMVFDEEGLIVSMRAFWSPETVYLDGAPDFVHT